MMLQQSFTARAWQWWRDTALMVGSAGIMYGAASGLHTSWIAGRCLLGYRCEAPVSERALSLAKEIDDLGDGYEWQAVPVERKRK